MTPKIHKIMSVTITSQGKGDRVYWLKKKGLIGQRKKGVGVVMRHMRKRQQRRGKTYQGASVSIINLSKGINFATSKFCSVLRLHPLIPINRFNSRS